MLTLQILRHAKADWPHNVEDFERPLLETGKKHAHKIAEKIDALGLKPDRVLCSPATRTRQTFAPLSSLYNDLDIFFEQDIYTATTGQLFEIIKSKSGNARNVMLIGHNPAIHGLAMLLSDEGGNRLSMEYKPGTLCILECPIESWNSLMPGQNHITHLLTRDDL